MSDEYLFIQGRRDAPILVISEPPDEEAYERNRAYTDQEQRFFLSVARQYGFQPDDFAFLPCAVPMGEDAVGDRDQSNHLERDRPEFLEKLKTCNPRMILCLGKHALRQLSGRAVQIGKARGRLADIGNVVVPVLPLSGVRQCLWFPENIGLFTSDFNLVATLDDADYNPQALNMATEANTDYQYTLDLSEVIAAKPAYMAVDTETTGLKWTDPNVRVLTVQLTWKTGVARVVPVDMRAARAVYPDIPERKLQTMVNKAISQLKTLLEDQAVKKIGHNMKFDHHHIRESLGIVVQNWRCDTQQLAFLVDDNMVEKSLDEVTRRWVPEMAGYADEYNATVDKSKMLEQLQDDPKKFLRYAGGDTDANYRGARALMRLAQQDDLQWNTYMSIQLPALCAFADRVEPTGLYVDRTKLGQLEQEIGVSTKETHERVISQMPADVRRAHLKQGLSLSRPDLIRDALFYHPAGLQLQPIIFTKGTARKSDNEKIASTSAKQHLIYHAHEPLVDGIMKWGKLEKMRTTYVGKEFDTEKNEPTGFWRHLVMKDSLWKIHPSFFLHRTSTGRSSSADPNAQNFPKRGALAKSFRSVFVPPPGYVIIEADLSQAELRIAACEAGERNMIRLYNQGVDIHANTGCAVSGNNLDWMLANKKSKELLLPQSNDLPGAMDFLRRIEKQEDRDKATVADFIAQLRFQAKAVNFGFLYGMQWRGFKSYAKVEYGIDLTDEQAQKAREDFFVAYPDLIAWHHAKEREVYEHGMVRSLHGAIRNLPSIYSTKRSVQAEAVRQAINSPVQRFASDLGIMALWRMCRDAPRDYVKPVAFIHDALVLYCREDKVQEVGQAVRFYMESNPLENWFNVRLPLPIVADVSVGARLSEMEEVHMESIAPDWWNEEADEDPQYVMQRA